MVDPDPEPGEQDRQLAGGIVLHRDDPRRSLYRVPELLFGERPEDQGLDNPQTELAAHLGAHPLVGPPAEEHVRGIGIPENPHRIEFLHLICQCRTLPLPLLHHPYGQLRIFDGDAVVVMCVPVHLDHGSRHGREPQRRHA